jgi:type IV pilus assembly protein PilO
MKNYKILHYELFNVICQKWNKTMDINLTEMDLSDIDWDFNEAWRWPRPIRISVIIFCCIAIIGAGIYYDTLSQLQELEVLQKKEAELKSIYEFKDSQAANFSAYQQQLSEIKEKLNSIVKQMPLEEEVAGLLVDISQTGISSGLEFKLFKPAPAVKRDFYSELPINIEVIGKYEELLVFISGLASLPRIVTIHDLNIVPVDKTKVSKHSVMVMSVLVKTYRENAEAQNAVK